MLELLAGRRGRHRIPASPWDENPDPFVGEIRERIHCDSILVGVVSARRPSPDELLICEGLPTEAVTGWIQSGHRQDQLLRAAMKVGVANGSASEAGWPRDCLPSGSIFAYYMVPDSTAHRRWWMAVVVRQDDAFDSDELRSLGLMLRRWKSHFNRPKEPSMARLLIGHDDRLIHSDPHGEQVLLDAKLTIHEIMRDLRPTIDQRWPKLVDREMHDIALSLAGTDWWVRFRRQRALRTEDAAYWYVEARPLEPDELVTVGVVPDDRVGHALGYIHDQFHNTPSLNEMASEAQISPFHFHRLFSQQVGVTPKQYVLQKQIQVARWLLRTRPMPISQIADEAGFASHGHFTSTFRRLVGESPSQYRTVNHD